MAGFLQGIGIERVTGAWRGGAVARHGGMEPGGTYPMLVNDGMLGSFGIG